MDSGAHVSGSYCRFRCSMLLLLVSAAGSVWLLENPASSLVMRHDRMQWLMATLKKYGLQTFRQSFWMAHYHHANCKRTKIWSTSRAIWKLDFGKLSAEKKKQHPSDTTKRYLNAEGKIRFSGTPSLKKSQPLGLKLLC